MTIMIYIHKITQICSIILSIFTFFDVSFSWVEDLDEDIVYIALSSPY